jgi:hypothetical protein
MTIRSLALRFGWAFPSDQGGVLAGYGVLRKMLDEWILLQIVWLNKTLSTYKARTSIFEK